MYKRLAVAIALCGSAACAQSLEFVSATEMPDPFGTFGGLSAIEVSPNGTAGLTLSDRGHVFDLTLMRDAGGTITHIDVAQSIRPPFGRDTEGLAISDHGQFVSFEGPAQVHTLNGVALPTHIDFKAMKSNGALEALAIDAAGRLYTLPERVTTDGPDFPLYVFETGKWTRKYNIPSRGGFVPVGADFGPDGLFYLLERRFTPLGFRSQVRRFDLDKDALGEVTLWTTFALQHGNLEGISVWTDAQGQTRITMVSDDNFQPVQRNQLVEYKVVD